MRSLLYATPLALSLAMGGVAHAQDFFNQPPVGFQAGTFLMHVRGIGVMPEDSGGSISAIGGKVSASDSASPELDLSYFITNNIAVELIAATTEHSIYANNTAIGNVKVGDTWVLPPTLTAVYHFMPQSRLSPYVGAGINATFYYGTKAAGGAVNRLSFQNGVGAVLQAGFDYNVSGRWFVNADVKQIFLNTEANLNGGAITAKTGLNPIVVGLGVGYRF